MIVGSFAFTQQNDSTAFKSVQSDTPPLANFVSSRRKACPNQIIIFEDKSENHRDEWLWTFEGGVPPTSSAQNPIVYFPHEGSFEVSLTVFNEFGSNKITRGSFIEIVYPTGKQLEFGQGFEDYNFLQDWTIQGAENIWSLDTLSSGYDSSNSCISVNNYSINAYGNTTTLESPPIDLRNKVNPFLFFDYAYTFYPTYYDSLAIYYSDDCGLSKNLLWKKGGYDLATVDSMNTEFIPSSYDWVTEVIDLGNLSTDQKKSIIFYFENIGYWGNNLYLDNILISDPLSIQENTFSQMSIYPNPVQDQLNIQLPKKPDQILVYNSLGQLIIQESNRQQIETNLLQPGHYIIRVKMDQQIFTANFFKE